VDRQVNVNLVVLGGSRAFGTAFPDCDYDYYGVFTSPLRRIVASALSRVPLKEAYCWQAKEMDYSFHELGKFLRLALAGNPTFLDVLYAPDVIHQDDIGKTLRRIRPAFISKRILDSYIGYATDQLQRYKAGTRLHSKSGSLNPKFISHALRLLYGGLYLARTGEFAVRLPDDSLAVILELREGDPVKAIETVALLRDELVLCQDKCSLPDLPDVIGVEEFLWEARLIAR